MSKKELKFIIHKHAATRLHYDFRLEVDGVLKSWAIPKGPSLNPQDKRLAMMVEDHPYSYKDFEGIIPRGYGAGVVMIWDRGIYLVDKLNAKDSERAMREGLKKGELHFTLFGKKVKGEFTLVYTPIKDRKNNSWLLIKKRDAHASLEDITLKDRSVVSRCTMEGIARKYQ